MSTPPPNYFTCTLGQAQRLNSTHPKQNLVDFLEKQSESRGNLPAAGFFFPSKPPLTSTQTQNDWDYHVINFRQIYQGLSRVVDNLTGFLPALDDEETTVAILYSSPGLFLFSWLALIASGHMALVISPQWTASVTARLCQACNVSFILADDQHEGLATGISEEARKLGFSPEVLSIMPKSDRDLLDFVEGAQEPVPGVLKSIVQMDDLAYLQTTSGSSTGIPKLVPQTHARTIGVLPRLDGSGNATLTTTALYYGGTADLLRAWTSNALIWLFPIQDVPVTSENVTMCLNTAATACIRSRQDHVPVPPVKYFASDLDDLSLIAEDGSAVKHLADMDVVGFGGSAVRADTAESLVKQGVPLVSRFASAECGFLMSSHRDYVTDKEWQYLRLDHGDQQYLEFEVQQNGGLSELIVGKDWPHLATTNREDGSYGTHDLFEQHPSIANAWRFQSQAGNPYMPMHELVVKYGNFSHLPRNHRDTEVLSESINEAIILTGATSFLGAHTLSMLLAESNIRQIYILVDETIHNDNDDEYTMTRIQNALSSRLLPIPPDFSTLVTVLPCTFSASCLGLDDTTYTTLLSTVTTIMHLAWDDSVLTPLSTFANSPHLVGLYNLLSLAANSNLPIAPRFIFSSSTRAASRHQPPIPESANLHPSASSKTGLGKSKWVGEQILLNASQQPRLRHSITIIRTGQLSASSQTGVWDTTDPCVLMLSTAKKEVVGCLPDLDQARRVQERDEGEELNWLPVDAAARALIEASLRKGEERLGRGIQSSRDDHDAGKSASQQQDLIELELDNGNTDISVGWRSDEAGRAPGSTGLKVIHMLPPPRQNPKKWSSLLIPLKMAAGVKIVSFDNWIGLLERRRREKGVDAHPSLKFISYWKQEYTKLPFDEPGDEPGDEPDEDTRGNSGHVGGPGAAEMEGQVSRVTTIDMTSSMSSFYEMDDSVETVQTTAGFEMVQSLQAMPSLGRVNDVDISQVNSVWKWIKNNL